MSAIKLSPPTLARTLWLIFGKVKIARGTMCNAKMSHGLAKCGLSPDDDSVSRETVENRYNLWGFCVSDAREHVSLSEVHRSIRVERSWPRWKRAAAFIGPGYLVAVGYMDPGNWATSLAGGSRFGYALLAVVLLSSLMAILLQSLSARLGIATGRDLATSLP